MRITFPEHLVQFHAFGTVLVSAPRFMWDNPTKRSRLFTIALTEYRALRAEWGHA